jgi:hypothetical protein
MLLTHTSEQTVRRPLVLPLMLALAMSSGAVGAFETSGATTQSLQQTTLHHWGWANPEIAGMVEHSSQALVDVLERADQALNDQETELAANNLAYADNIARSIELQMPFYLMKDRLENAKGKLQAGATHAFIDQLAPVYDSITDLQLVAPGLSLEVRGKLQQAEHMARSGKHQQALQQVDEVLDEIVNVRVYVPILDIQGQIDAARKALQQGHIQAARDRLDKALGSMIAIVQGGNSGL